MADNTFVKGFRTQAAYFVENVFGTYNISDTKARRIGGKVRGVNWTVRQNITQTGNIGQGRNYTQQLLGQYDASASWNFEVIDFSFLRFAIGDIAKQGTGSTEALPYFLVESELSGVDGDATSDGYLDGNTDAYTNIRVRPFSMLLYDMENAAAGSTYNDNVDIMKGCMINDFSISATTNGPIMCNVNIVVREIDYRRYLSASETPDFTVTTVSSLDHGNADVASTASPSYGNPLASQNISNYPPLMFYNGTLKIANESTDVGNENVLGQVTSFNYSYNNSLLTYRVLGSRFIELPQVGMRRQTLNCNVIFRLPANSDGIPTGNTTSILELIRNYLGYESTTSTTAPNDGAPFATTDVLKPALATDTAGSGSITSGSPQHVTPVEKYNVQLHLSGTNDDGNNRGATINAHNAAIEGFGVPIVLENGLIEIPINFSVRGMPYIKADNSDGSYGGRVDATTTTFAGIAPILTWWF